MKLRSIQVLGIVIIAALLSACPAMRIPLTVDDAFAGRAGAFVLIDCESGKMRDYRPSASSETLAPCSTFKIWSTLIGLESGLIASPEDAFYQWDGIVREIPDWNRDLTLKEAFQFSCVPAFQNLARRIGPIRMQFWIDTIGYGNRDTSSGIDVFWLPSPGRTTLLITPREQATLMYELVTGKLPFSEKSRTILKNMMKAKKTEYGTLYGKTGSCADDSGAYGWYVGYVESKERTYVLACTAKGENVTGKDALTIVETILMKQGLL